MSDKLNDADLVCLAAGLVLEQAPEATARIATEGAGPFLDSDDRTATMGPDKRNYVVIALSDKEVRDLIDELAAKVREVVKRSTLNMRYPWRD